jgi:tetratricopeptide (TPR) repeat protein
MKKKTKKFLSSAKRFLLITGMLVCGLAVAGSAFDAIADDAGAIEDKKNEENIEMNKNYDTIQRNRSSDADVSGQSSDENAQLKKDYLKLTNDYQVLIADRDNLLSQTKKLLAVKNRADEMLSMIEQIQGDVAKSKREKDTLSASNKVLMQRVTELDNLQKDTLASEKKLLAEKEELSSVAASLKSQINSGTFQKQIAELKKTNDSLAAKLMDSSETDQKLKDAQAKLVTINQQLQDTTAAAKVFEKKISNAPEKMQELARQNKALIEETATMHYNLGVFYTKQREFSRAAAEFKKSLELKPRDARVHFNLGYIYAEHVIDRSQAIEHFQEYLKYAEEGDKDIDWAKRYLVTWQSWQGSQPMN